MVGSHLRVPIHYLLICVFGVPVLPVFYFIEAHRAGKIKNNS